MTGWIVVRNWRKFQHYKDRQPPWVKNYTELLADHNYLRLTLRERGILHGIWIAYAASRSELGANPAELGRILGDNSVRSRDLIRLEQGGFIELLLAPRARSREVDREKEKSLPAKEASYDAREFSTVAEIIGRQAGFPQAEDQPLKEDEPWS